jgi:hypothetical protein
VEVRCISCHDGAYHLEKVNVELSHMTREAFWGMAAFFSKAGLYCEGVCSPDLDFVAGDYQILDYDRPGFSGNTGRFRTLSGRSFEDGEYVAETEAGDGMRPPRGAGTIEPAWLWSGEGPLPGETRRQAFARLLTSERQFARNMVNRMWKHFMGTAFVEPLNGFDLARLNAKTAARFDTTVQPNDPELMEYVTDQFIEGDYDIKTLIKLITTSTLYQLDLDRLPPTAEEPGPYWGGAKRLRRLEAQALLESISIVTEFHPPHLINGFRNLHESSWSFPGHTEPTTPIFQIRPAHVRAAGFTDPNEFVNQQALVRYFLEKMGRSNRDERTPPAEVYDQNALLTLLNGSWLTKRILGNSPLVEALHERWSAGEISSGEMVDQLYLRTLFRQAEPWERERAIAHLDQLANAQAIRDLLWSLINHDDFLFK